MKKVTITIRDGGMNKPSKVDSSQRGEVIDKKKKKAKEVKDVSK